MLALVVYLSDPNNRMRHSLGICQTLRMHLFEKKMYRFFAKHLLGDTRADYWGDINRSK